MQTQVVDEALEGIEQRLRAGFPAVRMEFARQTFPNHVELWVYVLDLQHFDEVRAWCEELTRVEQLDQRAPEIWLMARAWKAPRPAAELEQELRQRRDEFRRRHNLLPR